MYSQHSVTQHRTRSKDELHLRERERKERAERREMCVCERELKGERFVRGGGEKERIRVKICEIWKQCLVCVVEVGGDNKRKVV